MTERGILFSGAMVRALLDGSKTQTRRVCKTEPYSNGFHFDGREILCHNDYLPPSAMLMDYREGGQIYTTSNLEGWDFCCPYGQPGDRLWVRETWRGVVEISPPGAPVEHGVARYVPDQQHCRRVEYAATQERDDEPWRPSIHMPRWASRILLEIVSVRVERLQEISEADAAAEGWQCRPEVSNDPEVHADAARDWYMDLWEQINGAGSWEANPWVWVVEFRRIE